MRTYGNGEALGGAASGAAAAGVPGQSLAAEGF